MNGRWYRRRSGNDVDGCEALLGDVMAEELQPWVVLFASALELRNPHRRARRIAFLADAYRRLFPPPTVLHRPGAPPSSGLGP